MRLIALASRRARTPFALAVLAIACLSGMDAIVKAISPHVSVWQVVWLRYAFGLVFVIPFVRPHLRAGLRRASIAPNMARGVLVVFTAACFFFALGRIALIEAVTLAFTSPIWTAVLARLILKEEAGGKAWLAIGLGCIGIAVMWYAAAPDLDETRDALGTAAALTAAITLALALVLVRRQAAYDAVPTMVFLQTVAALLVATPMGVASLQDMTIGVWLAFACIGALGTTGHLLLSSAFAAGRASDLAPAEYTGLIWAVLFGAAFFDEWPQTGHLIAAGFIISGCVLASGARVDPA